jgi:hypothetical protein
VPDELNRVDKVGTFQQLVEMTEINTDLKNKVCVRACVCARWWVGGFQSSTPQQRNQPSRG